MMNDAFMQGDSHAENIRLVTENFSGKCVDQNTAYAFKYDFAAQEQAMEKTKSFVLLSLAVLPV